MYAGFLLWAICVAEATAAGKLSQRGNDVMWRCRQYRSTLQVAGIHLCCTHARRVSSAENRVGQIACCLCGVYS